eukprot:CAMPEP_0119155350 /NCGR_PEP_ID=MMETSP1310-20130426/51704_1 /TAXON_ID=464262 /ORGANISM="Genus nov. species nov., Strain RCC2339" /LENGTH=635 /DNA_ID=CAMNT_0007147947 /DNA_START=116 /DNA_END=2023 /DNA_ORIENTATION=-
MVDADVLVAGAGPVGMIVALELVRHGVPADRILLVDKAEGPPQIAKASSLWPRTMELLSSHERVLERLLEESNHVDQWTMVSREGGSPACEELFKLPVGGTVPDCRYQHMYTLPQFRIEAILRDELGQLGVNVHWGTALEKLREVRDGVIVELSGEAGVVKARDVVVKARYVVGADGAHSTVRHLLGLNFPGVSMPNRWFFIAHGRLEGQDLLPPDQLYVSMHRHGIGMLIPFKDGTWEILFDLSRERAMEMLGNSKRDPTLEEFNAVLQDRVCDSARVEDVQWLSTFLIHSRQVVRYSTGRVFLAGDACHIHSPVGGQGMNYGCHDAFNLGWKLAYVLLGRASAPLLDSYHTERHRAGSVLVHYTETQTAGLMRASRARERSETFSQCLNATLRRAGAMGVFEILSKNWLVPFLSETNVEYRKSALSHEHWELEPLSLSVTRMLHRRQVALSRFFRRRLVAGDRMPDVALADHPEGERTGDFVSGGFTAFFFEARVGWKDSMRWHGGQDVDLNAVAWELAVLTHGLVRCVVVGREEVEAQERFGVHGQCLVLVRPDGYVGMRSQPVCLAAITQYLSHRVGLLEVAHTLPEDWRYSEGGSHEATQLTLSRANNLLALTSILLACNLAYQAYLHYH